MTKTGRPGIGNYVSLPFGDLLDQVDRWATNHGINRNAAIRALVRLGLEHSGSDERVLIEGGDLIAGTDEHRSLVDVLPYKAVRRSYSLVGGAPEYEVKVVPFTDPHDGRQRYAVVELAGTINVWDYSDQASAEQRYVQSVRGLAAADLLFDVTDVDGVPSHYSRIEQKIADILADNGDVDEAMDAIKRYSDISASPSLEALADLPTDELKSLLEDLDVLTDEDE
jgi:hypothetical protein